MHDKALPHVQPITRTLRADPLFSRPVSIEEFRRPMMSDDVETAQTVYLMDQLAFDDAGHRLIIDATNEALAAAGIDLTAPAIDKACAVFWWLKQHIRYVPTPGTSPLVDQTLIPPATLLAMPDPEGDCPQFSMLAAAMLRVCCVPSQFKTIAADPDYPQTYSHIYNLVQIAAGTFLPFDSSNAPRPGAEFARPGKTRVWPQVNKDRCKDTMNRTAFIPSNRNRVLRGRLGDGHLYQTLNGIAGPKVIPANWNPWRNRLGQDDDGGDTLPIELPSTADTSILSDYEAANPQGSTAGGAYLMTGPSPTPGQLATLNLAPAVAAGTLNTGQGAPGTSLWSQLAADATSLLSPVVKAATQQTPYYVTNPQTGQSALYNPNTGQLSAVSGLAAITSNPTLLLVIGVGLVAAFAMSSK